MDPLAKAFAALQNPEKALRAKHFSVGTRNFIEWKKSAIERKEKARARKLIRPENADAILQHFPAPGDILHAITCGDFVLGDLVVRAVGKFGCPSKITIATLSMSAKNVTAFSEMMETYPSLKFDILLSHYFKNTNGEIFTALERLLIKKFPDRFTCKIERSHAKIILLDYPDAAYVLETSANLRSSNNIEQMVVNNNRELLEFHSAWIEEVASE